MRVKCSWCKKTLVFDDDDNDVVSHGICLTCGMKALKDIGVDPNLFFAYYLKRKQPKRIYSDGEDDY